MRAIRIHGFGGTDSMRLDEIPRQGWGVLVAAKVADVVLWDRCEGRISQAVPLTLRSEVSGTVAALRRRHRRVRLGDAI